MLKKVKVDEDGKIVKIKHKKQQNKFKNPNKYISQLGKSKQKVFHKGSGSVIENTKKSKMPPISKSSK